MKSKQDVLDEILAEYGEGADNLGPFVSKAENRIKLYCHIPFVPDELFYTWVDMSYKLYKLAQEKHGGTREVKRITQGKVSIEYSTDESSQSNEYSILMSYADELNQFRRVRF